MFLNYLIKLFGHSGSSNQKLKQAWLPAPAAPNPNAAKIDANNFIFTTPFHRLY